MRAAHPGGRHGAGSVLGVLALLLAVVPLEAQWLSAPGQGWLEGTLIYHDTSREFDPLGNERSIFADGRAITLSVFLTGTLGIYRGIDTWVQVPFHRLRFDDAGGERVSTGIGDPALFLRVGTEVWSGLPHWPVALRGGVKLPGGSFDVDPEIVPLGEGQVDWELMLELGRSFHPLPFWTAGWVGFRWRLENEDAGRKPGDEVFWLWSVGGDLPGPLGWKATLEGLSGGAWRIESLEIQTARRRLHQLFLEGSFELGPGSWSVGVRTPFSGRNLPTGTAFTTAYFVRWGGG
jgi:hypothetical protein